MGKFGSTLFIAWLACTGSIAHADRWHEQHRDSGYMHDDRSNDRRAMRDVIGEVEHSYGGHVVDVQRSSREDDTYRVRVLQDGGRVKTLRVPANHGKGRDR